MDMNATMLAQEALHEAGLVAADVDANDNMDLSAAGLAGGHFLEETDKLFAGVAGRDFAKDFAGGRVQRGEQAEVAIALVLEAVTFGTSRRQWQHSDFAVQSLDRRLLVHAEYRCMRRRAQVQANHIGRSGLEVRIVGNHVGINPMRTDAVFASNSLSCGERHIAKFGVQLAAAPAQPPASVG